MILAQYLSPTFFLRIVEKTLPSLIGLTVLCFSWGLFLALWRSPPDYQQGEMVRIMYVHVPAAWLCLLIYVWMAFSAIVALLWRHPLAYVSQKASAYLGAAFTLLCLLTGALWGKKMWGAWWVWDARLTSVLILFLLYVGILALWKSIEEIHHAARAAAILTLVGIVNIPIIKFSVDWWNSLHQPASLLRSGGPAIHLTMLWPLGVMACAYFLLFTTLHLALMRNELLRQRVQRLTLSSLG